MRRSFPVPIIAALWIMTALLAGPLSRGYAESYSVWRAIDPETDIDSLFTPPGVALVNPDPGLIEAAAAPIQQSTQQSTSRDSVSTEEQEISDTPSDNELDQPEDASNPASDAQSRVESEQFASLENFSPSILSSSDSQLNQHFPDLWTLIPMTSVVLVMALAAASLVKWYQSSRPMVDQQRVVRQVETLTIGARERLHLVAVHDENFLVAVDTHGIKSVTVVPSWARGIDPDSIVAPVEKTSDQGPFDAC
ncbi:flagellar biosynthetic protein FliO [Thalassoglobus neptunius]|nr:flagellar biosynthetic protein FliO [Thalassoglobus neptunius]